jgi:hypothetical protein
VRELCTKHGVDFDKDTALHALFGGYLKVKLRQRMIESEMTARILKAAISQLDAFNSVRNNKSFAHDNPILNHDEAVFIFNGISNLIRFLNELEKEVEKKEDNWANINF